MSQRAHSFTTVSQGRRRVLVNQCQVTEAWEPRSGHPRPTPRTFECLWDTGATNSMISERVVSACGLIPVNFGESRHAQGTTSHVPIYLVNIHLPNNVEFVGVEVMQGSFTQTDVLIGMDIIAQGDFAVTHPDGNTKFTFQMPAQADIDFVKFQPPPPPQNRRERRTQRRRTGH